MAVLHALAWIVLLSTFALAVTLHLWVMLVGVPLALALNVVSVHLCSKNEEKRRKS